MKLIDKITILSIIIIGTLCAYASGIRQPLGFTTGITCIISGTYIHHLIKNILKGQNSRGI